MRIERELKGIYAVVSVLKRGYSAISGEDREKDPPVHIPNTAVKLLIAESTALVTRWKIRTSPDSIKRTTYGGPFCIKIDK